MKSNEISSLGELSFYCRAKPNKAFAYTDINTEIYTRTRRKKARERDIKNGIKTFHIYSPSLSFLCEDVMDTSLVSNSLNQVVFITFSHITFLRSWPCLPTTLHIPLFFGGDFSHKHTHTHTHHEINISAGVFRLSYCCCLTHLSFVWRGLHAVQRISVLSTVFAIF
jgi:hypothetical protein